MARYGYNTSTVRSTKFREQPQDNIGGPISQIELEAMGEGDIQKKIQQLKNKKIQLLKQRKLQLLREKVEMLKRR